MKGRVLTSCDTGAGGIGGPERTNAIDRDACIYFIRASVATPSITKFLLVSALSSRRGRAPWWDGDSWSLVEKMNTQFLKHYYTAKLDADLELVKLGDERFGKDGFSWISLRPGGLGDDPEQGRVALGKTKVRGFVSRGDVAEVIAKLLEKDGVRGWIDLLNGEEEIGAAVERVVKDRVDTREGDGWEI